MKDINNIHKDIYHVLDGTKDHKPNRHLSDTYVERIGNELTKATLRRDGPRVKGKLWASDLGKRCLRQHWYNFNDPAQGEKLDGHTKFKFLYGNILEEAVLYYSEEAGHSVVGQQARVETEVEDWKISGRIDGVVDGVLMDVKSTSSFGYKRYKDGITTDNDSFGYLEQLGFYAAFNDFPQKPVESGFIWIDKQNGHIKYTEAVVPNRVQLLDKARAIIEAVDKEEGMVARGYVPEPYGKSGNLKLPMACSYCSYKKHCHRDANGGKGLRTFLYSQGPVYFTDIQREPRFTVPELT